MRKLRSEQSIRSKGRKGVQTCLEQRKPESLLDRRRNFVDISEKKKGSKNERGVWKIPSPP